MSPLAIRKFEAITSSPPTDYSSALQRLSTFAKRVRSTPMSEHEHSVTLELAQPITTGGPLFLLLQPLEDHPWQDGTAEVIEQCPTLWCLKEGVHACSHGGLDLIENVSVLDMRPFMSKSSYNRLTDFQRHELSELVFSAICSKKPDTLLCMGDGAAQFLVPRRDSIRPASGASTEIIYSKHPSHSVNYYPDCPGKRKQLFHAMERACAGRKLRSGDLPRDNTLLGQELRSIPLTIYREDRAAKIKDSESVQDLLLMLAELCLHGYDLPRTSLRASSSCRASFFTFEKWQIELMQCRSLNNDYPHDPKRRARTKLIPLFLTLNRSLKMVSYFFLNCEARWDQVLEALTYVPADIEHICQVLSGGKVTTETDALSIASLFDALPYTGFESERDVAQAKIKRITACLQTFIPHNYKGYSHRVGAWVSHFPDEKCKCKGREELPNGSVQLALRTAYVSVHSCTRSCWDERL